MRTLHRVVTAQPTSDGAGVRILRLGGSALQPLLDPFLMIDELKSEHAADYLGGFPEHPHRGFETITYMKQGRMRHRDHMGNEGVIEGGDLQWLTAGSGVLHAEMPEQQSGLLHGFQIWLNLAAAEKMQPPAYREIKSAQIQCALLAGGGSVRALCGRARLSEGAAAPPVSVGRDSALTTQPLLLDLQLSPHQQLSVAPAEDNSDTLLIYQYHGASTELARGQLGIYTGSGALTLQAGPQGGAALLLAGRPLREPIAQYGPFVMNTAQQIEQALADYRRGRLVVPVLTDRLAE
ncbi:pirin family protein [Gammaproteobacteria bacterium LSUCC0057]|uniref:Pirin family protein n=1 Tax=Gammaproteobacteria bacterium LSUCC0057 TaxID=2559237 RepID=A0A4Y8ULW5_9GAMM|nr:pirin family protein [Gammaproteobacteria bacterium LSUCC0057]